MSKQYAFPIGNPGVKSLRLMNFRHSGAIAACSAYPSARRSIMLRSDSSSSSGFKHDVVQEKALSRSVERGGQAQAQTGDEMAALRRAVNEMSFSVALRRKEGEDEEEAAERHELNALCQP